MHIMYNYYGLGLDYLSINIYTVKSVFLRKSHWKYLLIDILQYINYMVFINSRFIFLSFLKISWFIKSNFCFSIMFELLSVYLPTLHWVFNTSILSNRPTDMIVYTCIIHIHMYIYDSMYINRSSFAYIRLLFFLIIFFLSTYKHIIYVKQTFIQASRKEFDLNNFKP